MSRWVRMACGGVFPVAARQAQIYTGVALAGRLQYRRVPLFFFHRALPHGRSSSVRRRACLAALGLLFVRLSVPQALASSAHRQSIAAFARAESMQRRLAETPVAERTRTDYERAFDAYRAVYHGDPSSPDAAPAIAGVAELLASEGRCFHDAKLVHDAIAQWEFLRREYPTSPLRKRALLAEAELERPSAPASVSRARPIFVQHEFEQPDAEIVRPAPKRSPMHPPAVATIQGVRYWAEGNSTRIAIDMSGQPPYHVYRSPNGSQIALVFFGARPGTSLLQHAIAARDANLGYARASVLTGDQTELVLQLKHPSSYSSFTLPAPDRLIVDVTAVETRSTAPLAKTLAALAPLRPAMPRANVPAARHSALPGALQSVATSEPANPLAEGQPSLTRVLGLRVRRIVIDAGHGGHDSGTLGPGGLQEKDVALDVALRLGRLLQRRMGADVIYTRRTDKFVPLEQRTALANRARADLFLSIHANSSADADARGVETYFLNFTASPAALAVAARENAVSNRSEYELSDLVRRITLSDKIDESREFAGDVQQSLFTGLAGGNAGLKNRGVKQAPFVVLIGAHMPSILAEVSFLTNPTDASELAQAAYRERLAEALYRGVARYVDGMSGVRVAKTASAKVITTPAE
ncbi:MAG: N-acetylmuramoyl-L-alanine amidase [Acidobacteriaceae bacterium]